MVEPASAQNRTKTNIEEIKMPNPEFKSPQNQMIKPQYQFYEEEKVSPPPKNFIVRQIEKIKVKLNPSTSAST